MLDGQTFIKRFEAYCPTWLAEPGDPVGLHIGTLNKPLKTVMVTLDVRPEVVAEAIEKKVDLIVAKHPPIFRPIKRLTTDHFQEKMYADLLKHDIAVYAAHTNMDIIPNGLNDWFCERLGIEQTEFLTETHKIGYKKLAVFVPMEAANEMRQALGAAGAGRQGAYSHTSYSLIGTGRFIPEAGAQPTIGSVGKEEVVQETKIEVIFPETLTDKVIQAMLAVHPYEEPAYDLYSIESQQETFGIGRIGTLTKSMPLKDFVAKVKAAFHLDGVRLIATDSDKMIRRVAICGGSGQKFYPDALRKKADVYLTGDVYYHTAHDMIADNLPVIDPGHYIEALCKPKLVELFNQWKAAENWDVEFIESTVNTNPFQFK